MAATPEIKIMGVCWKTSNVQSMSSLWNMIKNTYDLLSFKTAKQFYSFTHQIVVQFLL